jgi:hypothetical protein
MFELISRVELFEDLGVKLPTCRQETDRRLNLEQRGNILCHVGLRHFAVEKKRH